MQKRSVKNVIKCSNKWTYPEDKTHQSCIVFKVLTKLERTLIKNNAFMGSGETKTVGI